MTSSATSRPECRRRRSWPTIPIWRKRTSVPVWHSLLTSNAGSWQSPPFETALRPEPLSASLACLLIGPSEPIKYHACGWMCVSTWTRRPMNYTSTVIRSAKKKWSRCSVVQAKTVREVKDHASLSARHLRVIYVPDPEPDSVFVITAYELTGKPLAACRRRRRQRGTR